MLSYDSENSCNRYVWIYTVLGARGEETLCLRYLDWSQVVGRGLLGPRHACSFP